MNERINGTTAYRTCECAQNITAWYQETDGKLMVWFKRMRKPIFELWLQSTFSILAHSSS
jgi:hypothetical protein